MHDGEERAAFRERFGQALAGESFRGLEIERTTESENRVQLAASTMPLRDADGTIAGVVAVMQRQT